MTKFSFILLFLIIPSANAQVELNVFNASSVVKVEKIEQNFNQINLLLKKYRINNSLVEFSSNIKSDEFNQNFIKLKAIVPELSFTPFYPSQPISSSVINSLFNDFIIKFETKYYYKTCEEVKGKGNTVSGYYALDPDEFDLNLDPQMTYCEFDMDSGKVWTKVAQVNKGDLLWNAWQENKNLNREILDSTHGVNMKQFSNSLIGRDLEVIMKVDGVLKNIIYYDVDLSKAFNSTYNVTSTPLVIQSSGFFYRAKEETDYTRCLTQTTSYNSQWNWNISDSNQTSCGTYNAGGGFILHGNEPNINGAEILYGLNQYTGNTFSKIEVYVRKITRAFPLTCQHGLDLGVVTVSGDYNIDPDNNGVSQSVYCHVVGTAAYTLLVNAGNNTRFNNKGVFNKGAVFNAPEQFAAVGFNNYLNSWNDRTYSPSSEYITFFIGGDVTGYMQLRAPKWGGAVFTLFGARNGCGQYSDVVIGPTAFGKVHCNSNSEVVTPYIYKNADHITYREYPSSVFALYYLFIR